jgi:ABC-type transport system involved in multi-copper enzyme maturation permease subunit
MISRAFGSEWVKLRRPNLFAGTYGALAGVGALLTVLVFNRAGKIGRAGREVISLARLERSDGLSFGLSRALPLLGVVALSIAAAQVAIEYSQGTLRGLLVREPRRLVLLAGKYVALLTFTLGAVVVACVAAGLAAFGMAHARGISTTAWTSSAGWHDNLRAFGDALAAMVGYTTLGVVLGTIIRSPVAAVVIGLAYLLPLEGILAAIVPDFSRWLPGQLLDSLARGGNSTATAATAAWTLALYLAAACTLAAVLFVRRDVTA